jgi:hypothetical protein
MTLFTAVEVTIITGVSGRDEAIIILDIRAGATSNTAAAANAI